MKPDTSLEEKSTNQEPSRLRFLRILVTALTLIMIFGFLIIFALIVTTFSKKINIDNQPFLDAEIALAPDEELIAITYHSDTIILLITLDDGSQKIRTLSSKTGNTLSDTVIIKKEP